jgi:taurine dioxygenase
MPFKVSPLNADVPFGAIVTELGPNAIEDPAVFADLRELWIDRGLVIFRGLEGGAESQLRLSEKFGELLNHPLAANSEARDAKLSDIRFDAGQGDLYEVDGELRGGFLPWHFDLVYVDYINRGGILRPIQLPSRGGDTGFIDQIAAYNLLPEDLAAQIEGKSVLYRFNIDSAEAKFGHIPSRCIRIAEGHMRSMDHFAGRPRSIHPLVYEQPETGRKVLNVSPWFAQGIEGMENEEGDALLRRVIDHAIRPELAYFHRWRADDMVLWDNWRMMHCACGTPDDENRLMQRTTIAGDYGLGRLEDAGAPQAEMLEANA